MTIYALCYHYDSFGGDDTAVLGLYSTEEKAFEAGRKKEKEAFRYRMWHFLMIRLRH